MCPEVVVAQIDPKKLQKKKQSVNVSVSKHKTVIWENYYSAALRNNCILV